MYNIKKENLMQLFLPFATNILTKEKRNLLRIHFPFCLIKPHLFGVPYPFSSDSTKKPKKKKEKKYDDNDDGISNISNNAIQTILTK
jgi:hypothetical protein